MNSTEMTTTTENRLKAAATHPLVDAELLERHLQLLNNRTGGTIPQMTPRMVLPAQRDGGGGAGGDYKAPSPTQLQVDARNEEELPQCKIRRNYSCTSCAFFTQNPRSHLSHLRDVHGEKIVINECKLCLYASRHFQKLVRHMKMVHGCSDDDNGGMSGRRHCNREARKRRLEESIETPVAPVGISSSSSSSLPCGGPSLKQLKSELQVLEQQLLHNVEAFNRQQQLQQLQQLVSHGSGNIFSMAFEIQLCMLPPTVPMSTSSAASLPQELEGREAEQSSSDSEELTQVDDYLTPEALDLSTGNSIAPYQCQKCSYSTPIRARFKKHVKYHSMPLIKCASCDFHSPYKWNLDRHTKNHGANGYFKCNVCDFSTNIKQSLTIHELNHHVASRRQASQESLEQQLDPNETQACPSPEKATELETPLNDLPPISCSHCQQIMPNAVELVQHLQQCEPALRSTTNLASDMELAGEEDYRGNDLSYCGVETAPGYGEVTEQLQPEDSDALKKVFKCPHCTFWAATASRFHVHIVGHLNRKPFECSLCSYRSNWRWDITKHIRLKTMRDKSHVHAQVLMNDETGRRNYAKYNQYLTLMKVSAEQAADAKTMRCGEMQSTSSEQHLLVLPQPEEEEEPQSDSLAALDLSVPTKPQSEQASDPLDTNSDSSSNKSKSRKHGNSL
ncbi:zinc finger protein 160 [Drosophila innubila]|uniref:zinc finger protein 160 n=1 Tax=Drosophila innubila TaxID=198719 RepID=UPI00148CFB24|nr:zinc finger protein 160 [Drosophila innubila]